MSLTPPPKDWFQPPSGNERTWIALALCWCVVLSLAMPYWHFKGKQNSTGLAYSTSAADFLDKTVSFMNAHAAGEYQGQPVAEPAPGGDAYLVAQMWRFWPVLKLKKDQTYRLHLSSLDLNHGFSVMPINMNFHILPGYDHVLTITPTQVGEFPIICNEFCGIGHHQMTGRILVVE